jgi:2-hydroxy-3-keto-5-methylthiopentenyl-1-phosphate phosphatase
MQPVIVVDFDGTVVRQDATDLILERFALPEWRAVEQEWVAGRIGSRECLARQIDLVRATSEQLDSLIGELDVDPAFARFTQLARELGYQVIIGSDGLDRVIASVLRRVGVELSFASNRLLEAGPGHWRVEFPHFQGNCAVASGTCKCAIPNGALTVLVGDGRSDFCAAGSAAWVLAKGALAEHCREKGIPHTAIDGFGDALSALRTLSRLIAPETSPASARAGAGASHA